MRIKPLFFTFSEAHLSLVWPAQFAVRARPGSETRSFVEGLELSGVVIGRDTREVLIDFWRRGCDWCAKEDARS